MPQTDREYFDAFAHAVRSAETPAPPQGLHGSRERIAAGLAVYRNNVRSSLSKALGEKFPVIEKLVGAAFFKMLANAYFESYPPSSPLIARYGDALPSFIAAFEPAQTTPYLSDVARLEIAWLESYHSADIEPMPAEHIAALSNDNLLYSTLALHPSLRLVSSSFPIVSIWQFNTVDDTEEKPNFGQPENALLSRPRRDVVVSAVSIGVMKAIAALREGAGISAAAAIGVEAEPGINLQTIFSTLFDNELIVRINKKSGD